jgi:hypothetical protein
MGGFLPGLASVSLRNFSTGCGSEPPVEVASRFFARFASYSSSFVARAAFCWLERWRRPHAELFGLPDPARRQLAGSLGRQTQRTASLSGPQSRGEPETGD